MQISILFLLNRTFRKKVSAPQPFIQKEDHDKQQYSSIDKVYWRTSFPAGFHPDFGNFYLLSGIFILFSHHHFPGVGQCPPVIHLQRGDSFRVLPTGTVRNEINNPVQIPHCRIGQMNIPFPQIRLT